MRLLWPGQSARLDDWTGRPFARGAEEGPTPRDLRLVAERVIAAEPAGPPLPDGPHARAAASILRYEVFLPRVIRPVIARAPLEVGDTVGARYGLPLGFALFFASRVVAVLDGEADGWWRTGFTYRTLAGHPELGEETFTAEKELATGAVRVALRSWSRPGLWLTRLGAPVARWTQRRANEGAMVHLEAIATTAQDRG